MSTPAMDDAAERIQLHDTIRAYAGGLREARSFSETAQKHTDDVLTWAIGLMGGGLLALPAFIAAACPKSPRPFTSAATLWVLGILLAVMGRVVGRAHRESDTMLFFSKTHSVERLLLDRASVSDVAARLLNVVNDDKGTRWLRGTRVLVEFAYYASHIALAAGVLSLFWRTLQCK